MAKDNISVVDLVEKMEMDSKKAKPESSIFDPPKGRGGPSFNDKRSRRHNPNNGYRGHGSNNYQPGKTVFRTMMLDEYDGFDRYQMVNECDGTGLFGPKQKDIVRGSFSKEEAQFMIPLTPDGGVRKALIREGKGEAVEPDATVWVHYISFVEGRADPMDCTRDWDRLAMFKLTDGGTLQGLEIGMRSMAVGEIAKFVLEPDYAYLTQGIPDLVPRNSRVMFIVELIKASTKPMPPPIFKMSREERKNMDFDDIYGELDELRGAGNVKFNRGKYGDALDRYEEALTCSKDATILKFAEEERLQDLRFRILSNMAQSYLNLGMPQEALRACRRALLPWMPAPNYKIFFRMAKANFMLKNLEKAAGNCERALTLSPKNWDLKMLKKQIWDHISMEDKDQAILYREMSRAIIPSVTPRGL